MSSGRGDLRERLPIAEVKEQADGVRERATEFYERTVASSDESGKNASSRAATAVSSDTEEQFVLSEWLGAEQVGTADDSETAATDADRSGHSSGTAGDSSADEDAATAATTVDAQFDFRGWLADGAEDVAALDGTATETADASAAEETTETSAETASAESSPAEPAEFDFATWVRAGDTELDPLVDPDETEAAEPDETDETLTEPIADATDAVGATTSTSPAGMASPVQTGSQSAGAAGLDRVEPPRPVALLQMHPVKGATLALFLAFIALAVLSMTGYLPPLGPSTGLAF